MWDVPCCAVAACVGSCRLSFVAFCAFVHHRWAGPLGKRCNGTTSIGAQSCAVVYSVYSSMTAVAAGGWVANMGGLVVGVGVGVVVVLGAVGALVVAVWFAAFLCVGCLLLLLLLLLVSVLVVYPPHALLLL